MKVILTLAALGLSVAGANACDYMKSAEAQVERAPRGQRNARAEPPQ